MDEQEELLRRKKIIAGEIRSAFKPGKKKPCVVCGKYRAISEAHHLIPVHEQVDFCIEHGIKWLVLPVRFVWLCPTHHTIFHAFYGKRGKSQLEESVRLELLRDMPPVEREAMHFLLSIVHWDEMFELLKNGNADKKLLQMFPKRSLGELK
jgi:hypothetical protein